MNLHVIGQFDDAEEENLKVLALSDVLENEHEYYSTDDDDKNIEKDKWLGYEDKFEHVSLKSQLIIANFEHKVDTSLKNSAKSHVTDKSDHATSDRVLDIRSKKIIYKMMLQGEFETVHGCMSAGKEANVYHAPTASGEDLVLKVYMTSIMPFRARQKYMKGDNRFKNANVGSSTKLVKAWAEKEFRNLRRLYDTNGVIPCPKPLKQKDMVLLMTMIGKDGIGAPRLKDVKVKSEEEWASIYLQVVSYVRVMFQDCHLVHADLSEYNLLYHEKKVYVIDVSQSVEHEHPETFNFLRRDCQTINTFFRNKNIATLSLKEFFFFVIDTNFVKTSDPEFYPNISRLIAGSTFSVSNEEDGAFLNCHIERYLSNIQGEQIHDQYKQILKNPDYVDNLLFAKVIGIDEELRNIRPNRIKSIKQHKRTLRTKKQQLIKELNGDDCEEEDEKIKEDCEVIKTEETEKQILKTEEEIETERIQNEDIEIQQMKEMCLKTFRPKNEDLESKKQRKKEVKNEQRNARIRNKEELLEIKFKTIPGVKYKNSKLN